MEEKRRGMQSKLGREKAGGEAHDMHDGTTVGIMASKGGARKRVHSCFGWRAGLARK